MAKKRAHGHHRKSSGGNQRTGMTVAGGKWRLDRITVKADNEEMEFDFPDRDKAEFYRQLEAGNAGWVYVLVTAVCVTPAGRVVEFHDSLGGIELDTSTDEKRRESRAYLRQVAGECLDELRPELENVGITPYEVAEAWKKVVWSTDLRE